MIFTRCRLFRPKLFTSLAEPRPELLLSPLRRLASLTRGSVRKEERLFLAPARIKGNGQRPRTLTTKHVKQEVCP